METLAHTKVEPVKIIYNDDEAILNYIVDLKDREYILRGIDDLNKKIKEDSMKNFMLLCNARKDNLVLLILCNAKYYDRDKNSHYILYSHSSLRQLCVYFTKYYQNIQSSDTETLKEVDEIRNFLTYQWAREDEKNTPADFRG